MPIQFNKEPFANRHIGPSEADIKQMLKQSDVDSVSQLIGETIPKKIRLDEPLNLPPALAEDDYLENIRSIASKNQIFRSFIGMGYYETITPNVILRNVLENPGWYTAYTPYQAEIAQGRLEALINFQTMVSDLTGMEIANASLLDEGTAAAEAISMLYGRRKGKKRKQANVYFVSENCHPQTISVIENRMEPLDIEVKIGNPEQIDVTDPALFGILVQFPDTFGNVNDLSGLFEVAKENDVYVTVAADLLSLTLLTPPGEMGADVVVGTTQRFGVPMGYGGPHAAFFATKEEYKRQIPGRIIGVSKDRNGHMGLRMALQTREQHIKRERATSNICTAQALLAVMASMYAVYHGPVGLKTIAENIHLKTTRLASGLQNLGYTVLNKVYFDTLFIELPEGVTKVGIEKIANEKEINLRYYNSNHVGISMDETISRQDFQDIYEIFLEVAGPNPKEIPIEAESPIQGFFQRESAFLEHPVFNMYHSETELMRYIKRLE